MGMRYNFKIKTANKFGAGTDSNIFITLYGAQGISPEIRLNGYISGNAFERDKLDECSVYLDDDCGDIYMIEVRSDMHFAGAEWLCDYFAVQRENGTVVEFQIPSGQWIKDREVHRYHATKGYDYKLSEPRIEWKKVLGLCHYIPSHISMDMEVRTELTIEVVEVSVINAFTQKVVDVEMYVIKKAFELLIDSSPTGLLDNQLYKPQMCIASVHIPATDRTRELQEVWSECDYIFTAQLGGNTYNFRVPKQKIFCEFVEVSSSN